MDDFNKDFIDVTPTWLEGNNNFKSSYNNKPFKHKDKSGGRVKKILSYIIVGVLCTTIGGVASSIATIKYFTSKNAETTSTVQNSTTNTQSTSSSNSVVPLSVANIAKKVGPAVVGVSTKSISTMDFFGFPENSESEGMGSGIIFSEEGYILTNYHVVSGASQINVIFNDGKEGKEIPAKVVNYNQSMDLAVIKLTEDVDVPAVATFGDSSALQVGDPVIAIGNPLGKELLGTVTSGVVSAVNRQVEVDGNVQTYIQTDAAINPGNSGGALVNIYGEVIGINSAKIGGSEVEGLGFAIPINNVKTQIESLIKPNLKLGIMATDVTSEISKRNNIPIGIYVNQVQEFSPAEKAGILPGDVIIKFDGKTVKTVEELNKIKQTHNAGDKVKVVVNRDGREKTLTVELKE